MTASEIAGAGLPAVGDQPGPDTARFEAMERGIARSMAGRPGVPFGQWLYWAGTAVLAGTALHRLAPHPAAAVAAAAALLAAGGAMTTAAVRHRARAQPEPEWVRELADYRQWLPGRVPPVPAATLGAADRYLAAMTARGWQSAQLVIARYDGPPASMGGTNPVGDRLQIILGSHVAEGPSGLAAATLAHEARHAGRLWLAVRDLATALRGNQAFIVFAGWAWSWQGAAVAVIALRLAAMLIRWAMEIGCDLGAAADHGPAVMAAVYDVMAAGATARGTRPAARRAIAGALRWASGPPHPPIALRRAVIRTRYRLLPPPRAAA